MIKLLLQVDKLVEGAHPEFRLFLSAEPPPALEKGLPISLLQNAIKLTNEPPEGLKVWGVAAACCLVPQCATAYCCVLPLGVLFCLVSSSCQHAQLPGNPDQCHLVLLPLYCHVTHAASCTASTG